MVMEDQEKLIHMKNKFLEQSVYTGCVSIWEIVGMYIIHSRFLVQLPLGS